MGLTVGQYVPIPGPKGVPVLGNVFDVDAANVTICFQDLTKKYGEIFQLKVPGAVILSVNSAALITEVCSDDRFSKLVEGGLLELRHALHNGLLTADTSDPAWHIAHRIAAPCFTPVRIREMFDEMKDITTQLCLKWARLGPSYVIDVNTDFTRMALDIIGLCGMGYRFNTFYNHEESHPVAVALNRFLHEANARPWRVPFANSVMVWKQHQFFKDIECLRNVTQNVINARRSASIKRNDILTALMDGIDPETGTKLSDDSVIDNLVTFIGAGHETTSGTLAFALFFLVQNPQALIKAQQEVDSVIGEGTLTVDHLSKLPYIDAILRETLRFHPTVPLIARTCEEDQILGEKYLIKKDMPIILNLFGAHRDAEVFGPDADQWKPERMLGDNFKNLPAGAWRAFGTGIRACIGRAFAWQELQITLAMILHSFNFEAHDPGYKLRCKDAITLNPVGFKIRAYLRDPAKYHSMLQRHESQVPITGKGGSIGVRIDQLIQSKPMTILYGSDSGTAQSLAHLFASHATTQGYSATVNTLNTAKEKLPTNRPVIIFTSSYNGEPPLTAAHYLSWLQALSGNELEGVSYAVFGCGNRDWSRTFQRVPSLIDELMAKRGGTRIIPMSSVDASMGNVISDFQDWVEQAIWPALQQAGNTNIDINSPVEGSTAFISSLGLLQQDLSEAYVSSIRTLTSPGAARKLHLELDLPADLSYNVGDYMVIAPTNPAELVQRAFSRFGLTWDSKINIESNQTLGNETKKHVAHDVFSRLVELSYPASVRDIRFLITYADDNDDITRKSLEQLAGQNNSSHLSLLDILEEHPSITISAEQYLSRLPPLYVRTYSISSSPLQSPNKATITLSVVIKPTQGKNNNPLLGVASNYLANLTSGAIIRQSLRSPRINFTLPTDAESTPIIVIAAGSGIAPFRGFIQERHIKLQESHSKPAAAILFFGCRSPDLDDLYREELDTWQSAGAVTVYRAYSRPAVGKGKYVQDILGDHTQEIQSLWNAGARCYVCGAAKLAEGVRTKFEDVVGVLSEADLKADRFLTEIFS